MSPLYENRCLTVGLVQMRLRQSPAECDGGCAVEGPKVGPVGDKIGSPRPPGEQGEPRVSVAQGSPRLTPAHAAQGGVTLGLEQGATNSADPIKCFRLSYS